MKVKHYLNVHHLLPNFPDVDDFLFEVEKNFRDDEFTFSSLKSKVTFKLTKEIFNENIEKLIKLNKIKKINNSSFKIILE